MTAAGWIEIALYIALLTAITPLLGGYMTRVYRGEIGVGVVDRLTARLFGDAEQDWKGYAKSVLVFSAVFFGVLYLILRPRMPYDVTFNTTASFITNTNWQFYAGETTLSSLQQMAGLAVQNFVSAAVGIAVVIASSARSRPARARPSATSTATSSRRSSTCSCRSRSWSASSWSPRA
jgi:potassium-transporting ATPase potassium-binding subunit